MNHFEKWLNSFDYTEGGWKGYWLDGSPQFHRSGFYKSGDPRRLDVQKADLKSILWTSKGTEKFSWYYRLTARISCNRLDVFHMWLGIILFAAYVIGMNFWLGNWKF
jgi:hypothetical protein